MALRVNFIILIDASGHSLLLSFSDICAPYAKYEQVFETRHAKAFGPPICGLWRPSNVSRFRTRTQIILLSKRGLDVFVIRGR